MFDENGSLLLQNTNGNYFDYLKWACCPLIWISNSVDNSVSSSGRKSKHVFMLPLITALRKELTHWGREKMDAISQTTFSSAFSWMKMFEFQLRYHWSLFLNVQLTIFQHWCLAPLGDKPLSETMMVFLPTDICVTRPQWVKCFTRWTGWGVGFTSPSSISNKSNWPPPMLLAMLWLISLGTWFNSAWS